MATEILLPQDCLIERIRVPPASFSRRRSYGNNSNYYYHSNHHAATSRSSRKPVIRPDHRKRVGVGGSGQQPALAEAAPLLRRTSSADDSRFVRSSGFAMEKVTILRRGQSLDSATAAAVNGDVYAGSAFAVSPSPSALPLPSFPTKKHSSPAPAAVDDSATHDLRRLLRLG